MREGWNACMRQRDAEKENLEAAGEGLEQSFERAEEITRLKGVLVKCKEALKGMHEWFEAEENHAGTTFHERVEMCQAVQVNTVKALAALKEEGL
jgi:5-formaminoimidazole-4-carboxamide-1-beta-D-ribofuranosyl 5'-monophosphate synthetase